MTATGAELSRGYQLPTRSPVPGSAILLAALKAIGGSAATSLAEHLAQRYNAAGAFLCGSGTQALQLAIETAAAQTGQRSPGVALPAFGCFDLASAAVGAGFPVHFFDVDPSTLAPDLASLDRALAAGAAIVVHAPLFGIPVDMGPMLKLARRYGGLVIHDAAQSHGTAPLDAAPGYVAPLTVLSFGRGKGWTGGGGGALVVHSSAIENVPALARPPSGIRPAAVAIAACMLGRPALYGVPMAIPALGLGRTIYHDPVPPRGLADFSAELLLATRAEADREASRRRVTAESYRSMLHDLPGATAIQPSSHRTPGYLRFPVRLDMSLRPSVEEEWAARAGVVRGYPRALPRLPQVRAIAASSEVAFPGADRLVAELVTLPTHAGITMTIQQHIINRIATYPRRAPLVIPFTGVRRPFYPDQPESMSSSSSRPRKATPTIAVIGCGAIAESFHLPGLARNPEVVSRLRLVDPALERAHQLGEKFGARHLTTDYQNVLDEVDGAIILTPPHSHAAIALDCIAAGVPILIEKPLAASAADAARIATEASRNGVPVLVNNTRRLIPSFRKVGDLIRQGALGSIREIHWAEGDRFDWPSASGAMFGKASTGRGVFLDIGSHVVDLVCWWLGQRPDLVSYQDDAMGGSEAVARASLRADRCQVQIRLSSISKLANGYSVQGERARIEGSIYDWHTLRLTPNGGRTSTIRCRPAVREYSQLADTLIDNFLQVIAGAAQPLVPAADVLRSMELIDECYASRQPLPMPWFPAPGHDEPDVKILTGGAAHV